MYHVDHIFSKAYKKKEIEFLEEAGATGIYITSLFEEHYCGVNTKIRLNAKIAEKCEASLYEGQWHIRRNSDTLFKIEAACRKIKDDREQKIMKTTIAKLQRRK